MENSQNSLSLLVRGVTGERASDAAFAVLAVPPAILNEREDVASRGVIAFAMNMVLMHDLLRRVPTGAAYVEDLRSAGQTLIFDHGALRTIAFEDGGTGALPRGEAAFRRILEPLGYRQAGLYPLDRLKMTGRSYAHVDQPEGMPQFFVSELHVERFSPDFQAAAHRVFDEAVDPLTPDAMRLLGRLANEGALPFAEALRLLPVLVAAFARTHPIPALADYEILRAESAEAAWIATEGWVFNHVTDRVADLDAVVLRQRALARPMKDAIEVSRSGRVRQTAFRADPVLRRFRLETGDVLKEVPGSFYEFISRDHFRDEDGQVRLDLAFDTGNAQGIFKMTA